MFSVSQIVQYLDISQQRLYEKIFFNTKNQFYNMPYLSNIDVIIILKCKEVYGSVWKSLWHRRIVF